jgi:protein involved in polysaccharide export with SLBB domain
VKAALVGAIVVVAFAAPAQTPFSTDWTLLPGLSPVSQPKVPARASEYATLEGAVDPETYVVGPGDRLSINVWGDFEQTFEVVITPEATLLIPTIGVVVVKDSTLAAVRRTVESAASRVYRAGRVTTTLLDVRRFRVSVTGAVNNPGTYPATAADRAGDLIAMAMEPLDTARIHLRDSTLAEQGRCLSKRDVFIIRTNDDTLSVDLELYERAGVRDANPNLRDGDVIVVPTRPLDVGLLQISGAVRNPAYVEFAAGDSLGTAIALAQGLTNDAITDTAEVVRFVGDRDSTVKLFVPLSDLGFPLQPDDRVYVRPLPQYHEAAQIEVRGRVAHEGFYAIVEGVTRLSDVIRLSGGFLPDASLGEATLIRQATEEVEDPEFERLRRIPVADMTETEYAYFKTRSREVRGRVSVDFNRLFTHNDPSQDRLLRDQDIVEVPQRTFTVTVSGEARNPGILPFVDGQNVEYYVELSGGYSSDARKGRMRVIRAATGEWAKAKGGTLVYLGDTIWIPSKPERNWWEITKDIVTFTASAATIVLVIDQMVK